MGTFIMYKGWGKKGGTTNVHLKKGGKRGGKKNFKIFKVNIVPHVMAHLYMQKFLKFLKKNLSFTPEENFCSFLEKLKNCIYLLNEGSNQKILENRPLLEFDFTPRNTPVMSTRPFGGPL